jgi:hypothetical protein
MRIYCQIFLKIQQSKQHARGNQNKRNSANKG